VDQAGGRLTKRDETRKSDGYEQAHGLPN
jgi:hypothetical protein